MVNLSLTFRLILSFLEVQVFCLNLIKPLIGKYSKIGDGVSKFILGLGEFGLYSSF